VRRGPFIPKERRAEALLGIYLLLGVLVAALPVERTLGFAHDATARANDLFLNTFQWVYDLSYLARENRELHSEMAAARLRIGQLEETARQNDRLRELLAFRERGLSEILVGAEVIGWGDGREAYAVSISAGEADGVDRGCAVVTAEGLAGRIEQVTGPHTALVSLLNDPTNAVAAVIERTREHGIFRFEGRQGVLEFVLQAADVRPGDRVFSSGRGGVYPAGLLIGAVRSVQDDPDRVTKRVEVELAVKLDRIEEVFVLPGGMIR
jgi:rod shape-determining protein MreC